MRRAKQVRLTDWAVRILVAGTVVAFFVVPNQWGSALMLVSLVAIGVWSIVYPEGVLGWVRTAHPSLDVDDSSIWWVSRLIGAFFLVFAVLVGLNLRGGW